MPGVFQQSADRIVEDCREVEGLGIPSVILFGLPETKDPRGESSLQQSGVVQRAIDAIRKAKLNLVVITDVCLCEYTDHGHCGVVENGEVANDATLTILAEQALSHARAGADIVAPSDMMDGRVSAIRKKLDVSGEYAMVKAAAQNGWLDEKRVVLEILTGIQRAGADIILTYHAKDAARWLK